MIAPKLLCSVNTNFNLKILENMGRDILDIEKL